MRVAIDQQDLFAVAKALDAVIEKLLSLAAAHRDTIVPNYTNGVAAQPNSYAHYLLGFTAAFLRDRTRLNECLARYNECPLGSTVLNGTGRPLDLDTMAKHICYERPSRQAFASTSVAPVDFTLEIASVAASIGIYAGSLINDIMLQYAQPRPWIIL